MLIKIAGGDPRPQDVSTMIKGVAIEGAPTLKSEQ